MQVWKCECDLGTLQEQDREAEKVHDFLCRLDDNYRTVKSTLVSRTPIQYLEEVYNIIRQEEDLKAPTRITDESTDVAAYAVQAKPRVSHAISEDEKMPLCKHFHRTGHPSNSCFAVIGTRNGGGDRPRGRTMQERGRGGSKVNGGVGRGWTVSYVNVVRVPQIPSQAQVNHVITDKDRDGVNALSDSQWHALVSILNVGAGTSNNVEKFSDTSLSSSWILDTGASHHLTGNFSLLTNVRRMEPVLIILTDGRE